MKHRCPKHNCKLIPKTTKYGTRWQCPVLHCSVCCWNGSTSTPADDQTRDLRRKCHAEFDCLWKYVGKNEPIFRTRGGAYDWLSHAMEIEPKKCHIGSFTADQCQRLLAILHERKTQCPT